MLIRNDTGMCCDKATETLDPTGILKCRNSPFLRTRFWGVTKERLEGVKAGE